MPRLIPDGAIGLEIASVLIVALLAATVIGAALVIVTSLVRREVPP